MVNPGWLQRQPELRRFHKLPRDIPAQLLRATAKSQNPALNILCHRQLSSVPPPGVPAQTTSCRKPQAGTVTRAGGSAAAGREVGAAASPAEQLAWTSTRCPPRWAGGAGIAAKGFSTGRPPMASLGCPHPPAVSQ